MNFDLCQVLFVIEFVIVLYGYRSESHSVS